MSKEPYVETPPMSAGENDPGTQTPSSGSTNSGTEHCAQPEGDCSDAIGGLLGLPDIGGGFGIGALVHDTLSDGSISAAVEVMAKGDVGDEVGTALGLRVSGDLDKHSLGVNLDTMVGGVDLLDVGRSESDDEPLISAGVDLGTVGALLCGSSGASMPDPLVRVDVGMADDGDTYDPEISVAVDNGACGLSLANAVADTATLLDDLPVLDGLLGCCDDGM